MTYKYFIFSVALLEEVTEPFILISNFLTFEPDFPDTEDIQTVIEYLYPILDIEHTDAFQKTLIVYLRLEKGKRGLGFKEIMIVNKIRILQDDDHNYQYKRPSLWTQILNKFGFAKS